MFNSLFSSPKVVVSLEDDWLLVHPIDASYPTNDPTLNGTVLVTLPSKRSIARIKVILEGVCDVARGNGHGYEQSKTITKELVTELKGEEFDQGNHHFNFSFIVPSSTAVAQRCTYGRVRHYVKAIVEFEGRLTSSISSTPTSLWITANPSPPGEIPLPTDVTYQHFSEELGPVGIHVSSPHFTVAALCNLRVSILGAPRPVTVTSIKGFIHQAFTIELEDGTKVEPKPARWQLVKVDNGAPPLFPPPFTSSEPDNVSSASSSSSTLASGLPTSSSSSSSSSPYPLPRTRTPTKLITDLPDSPVADPYPLVALPAATEFHYSRICRVPDDDHCRPTTLEGSEGRIRVKHKLAVEIKYRKEGHDAEMTLTIAKPITLASCCCLIDRLYLPAYSRAPPKTVLRRTTAVFPPCMCLVSLKEAFDRDGEALQRAGEIESDPYSTRHGGGGGAMSGGGGSPFTASSSARSRLIGGAGRTGSRRGSDDGGGIGGRNEDLGGGEGEEEGDEERMRRFAREEAEELRRRLGKSPAWSPERLSAPPSPMEERILGLQ
ncbi:hypothetical protein JCM10212_002891 [Sporobolomyces blumeae]